MGEGVAMRVRGRVGTCWNTSASCPDQRGTWMSDRAWHAGQRPRRPTDKAAPPGDTGRRQSWGSRTGSSLGARQRPPCPYWPCYLPDSHWEAPGPGRCPPAPRIHWRTEEEARAGPTHGRFWKLPSRLVSPRTHIRLQHRGALRTRCSATCVSPGRTDPAALAHTEDQRGQAPGTRGRESVFTGTGSSSRDEESGSWDSGPGVGVHGDKLQLTGRGVTRRGV